MKYNSQLKYLSFYVIVKMYTFGTISNILFKLKFKYIKLTSFGSWLAVLN